MRADVILSAAARRLEGPLLFAERAVDVSLNEAVEVIGGDGRARVGRVAALDEERMVIEVLESTTGLGLGDTRLRILHRPLVMGVGPDLPGRVFNSVGEPIDGGPPVPAVRRMRVDGLAINPAARALPRDFIETSISTIDLMNSLVRGQKLPLFSCGGLPHDRLATQIAQRARLRGDASGEFCVVFVGIGIPYDIAQAFRAAMEESGALAHTVMFLNHADDPSTQRLLTPRFALTAAEYLAFVEGRHVLVVMTDMTNYCEALREVSASHGEIPSRKGYPGYMYSDLASLFERAGCIRGLAGTLTQLPILTMPGDDIGHPIPDLTGYITEGQIVLGRELDRKGVYPPVEVLPSLSRLMDSGTGKGYTHPDHPALAHQLFASYARATRVRVLASVMGSEGLPETDRRFLAFGDAFEQRLVCQDGPRTLEESMALGWELLRSLPGSELTRLSSAQLAAYIEGEPAEPEAAAAAESPAPVREAAGPAGTAEPVDV
jgi:V/A-type H+-transporting ATPase subunit B